MIHASSVHEQLLSACREALTWQAEGEDGDAIPEQFWTPKYLAFMERLRAAVKNGEAK